MPDQKKETQIVEVTVEPNLMVLQFNEMAKPNPLLFFYRSSPEGKV